MRSPDQIQDANGGTGPLVNFADLSRALLILGRRWPVVLAALLACLALASVYLLRTKKVYLASARLMVLQQGGRPITVVSNGQARMTDASEDPLATHIAVISSPLIVRRAIESLGPEYLPGLFADAERMDGGAVALGIRNMSVTRLDYPAKILKLEYRASSRDEALKFLDAVIKSYQDFLLQDLSQKSDAVITLIGNAKGDVERELEELEKRYVEFRRKYPDVTASKTGHSLNDQRVGHWSKASAESMVKLVRVKAQLELIRRLAAEGTDFWAIGHALTELGNESGQLLRSVDPRSAESSGSEYVRHLTQEKQRLAEEVGRNYSKVAELQDKIANAQGRSRGEGGKAGQVETRDLIRSTEKTLESLESLRADYQMLFDADLKKANEDEVVLLDEQNLRNNLERHRTLFNTVVDQLKQAQLESNYNTIIAKTIEPPRSPAAPVRPIAAMVLGLGLLSGCLSGFAAALVAENFDTLLRSPDELRDALRVRVLGVIQAFPKAISNSRIAAGSVALERPLSRWAEAYRSVRTNVEIAGRDRKVKVFLITSLNPNEGKSVTASNLAIGFAQAGKRVLLIDADLRRPRQHEIWGLEARDGIVGILRNSLPFLDGISATSVPRLDVLPSGPSVSDSAELLSSDRWSEVIQEARGRYDAVIIDTPPLLCATDTWVLSAQGDGLVLVLRLGDTRRPEVTRAREVFEILGIPVLGAIFNAVDPKLKWHRHRYGYYGGQDDSDVRRRADVVAIGPSSEVDVDGRPGRLLE